TAEIADDDELVRATAFAKLTAAHAEAAAGAGKTSVGQQARGLSREAVGEAEFGCITTKDTLRGFGEEELTSVIGESQFSLTVEGEDRDFDFFHDRAEQRGGFEGAQALFLKRATERIDLGHRVAEGFVATSIAGADGKISLAQCGKKIGHGLQRPDHAG